MMTSLLFYSSFMVKLELTSTNLIIPPLSCIFFIFIDISKYKYI